MDVRHCNLLPRHATSPQHARALLALDGAALLDGITSDEDAVATATAVLGDRAVMVRPQFEVTPTAYGDEATKVAAQPPDARGRKRQRVPLDGHQPAHNDGFGFGDFAPDYMFLYCDRPCELGGASFLVDALRVLAVLSADDPDFAAFAWDTPIDHSMPNFPHERHWPIARVAPGGRTQVRAHPDQATAPGDDSERSAAMLSKWSAAVATARAQGSHFRAAAGEMICIDNYRMLHGRNGVVSPQRRMVSIWAWTRDAVAIPAGPLDIAEPDLAALAG